MPYHDRTWQRRIRRDALQPADPLLRQDTELHPDLGRRGCDRVVVLSLDPHEARRLSSAKPERERRPERDRHLPHEVAHTTSADNALDPVDKRDRLQATLEHREQSPLVTRVYRVLTRHEPDIRRDPGKPFALDRAQVGKDRDTDDLVHRHHGRHALRPAIGAVDVCSKSRAPGPVGEVIEQPATLSALLVALNREHRVQLDPVRRDAALPVLVVEVSRPR